MRIKLITSHPQYWLLVDKDASKIKKSDDDKGYCLGYNRFESEDAKLLELRSIVPVGYELERIIAYLPKGNLSKLEGVNLLPKLTINKTKEEWVDFFKNKADYLRNNIGGGEKWNRTEFSDKIIDTLLEVANEVKKEMYDEEQMELSFTSGMQHKENSYLMNNSLPAIKQIYFKDLIKQPIDFEVEMIKEWGKGSLEDAPLIPKVINNIVQGKWIYK